MVQALLREAQLAGRCSPVPKLRRQGDKFCLTSLGAEQGRDQPGPDVGVASGSTSEAHRLNRAALLALLVPREGTDVAELGRKGKGGI